MKYKVGDRVRIVNERIVGMNTFGKMDSFLGTIMTITQITDSGTYKMFEDGGYWIWGDNMIQGYADDFEPWNVDKLEHIEKSCENCSFCDRACDEYPCTGCKRNHIEPNDYPDLWTYTKKEVDCIDEMVAVFGINMTMEYCLMNVWKYRYRAYNKNGIEDLQKSDWYMKKYLELSGGDE